MTAPLELTKDRWHSKKTRGNKWWLEEAHTLSRVERGREEEKVRWHVCLTCVDSGDGVLVEGLAKAEYFNDGDDEILVALIRC